MITYIKQLQAIIAMANAIKEQAGASGKGYSFYLTNRSFIALVFAFALNVAVAVGLPVPAFISQLNADVFAGYMEEGVTALLLAYSGIERLMGKTRAVFNMTQAKKAIEEAASEAIVAKLPVDEVKTAIKQAGLEQVVSVYKAGLFGIKNK